MLRGRFPKVALLSAIFMAFGISCSKDGRTSNEGSLLNTNETPNSGNGSSEVNFAEVPKDGLQADHEFETVTEQRKFARRRKKNAAANERVVNSSTSTPEESGLAKPGSTQSSESSTLRFEKPSQTFTFDNTPLPSNDSHRPEVSANSSDFGAATSFAIAELINSISTTTVESNFGQTTQTNERLEKNGSSFSSFGRTQAVFENISSFVNEESSSDQPVITTAFSAAAELIKSSFATSVITGSAEESETINGSGIVSEPNLPLYMFQSTEGEHRMNDLVSVFDKRTKYVYMQIAEEEGQFH